MSGDLIPRQGRDLELAARFAGEARASNTQRAYRFDWDHFQQWCRQVGREPMPASGETVALFLEAMAQAGLKASTIGRRAACISTMHRVMVGTSPCDGQVVRDALRAIRRRLGTRPTRKRPLEQEQLQVALAQVTPQARALLLLGFAGAFRRSELVALDWEDITFQGQGLVVLLRHSKTDQEGRGREVVIPFSPLPQMCAVRALEQWREDSTGRGPIFRGNDGQRLDAEDVARAVKYAVRLAGGDPRDYAGHSLRAGYVSAQARAGVPLERIMATTGHVRAETAMGYIRRADPFRDGAPSVFQKSKTQTFV